MGAAKKKSAAEELALWWSLVTEEERAKLRELCKHYEIEPWFGNSSQASHTVSALYDAAWAEVDDAWTTELMHEARVRLAFIVEIDKRGL